jgi:hypothetical protein
MNCRQTCFPLMPLVDAVAHHLILHYFALSTSMPIVPLPIPLPRPASSLPHAPFGHAGARPVMYRLVGGSRPVRDDGTKGRKRGEEEEGIRNRGQKTPFNGRAGSSPEVKNAA